MGDFLGNHVINKYDSLCKYSIFYTVVYIYFAVQVEVII